MSPLATATSQHVRWLSDASLSTAIMASIPMYTTTAAARVAVTAPKPGLVEANPAAQQIMPHICAIANTASNGASARIRRNASTRQARNSRSSLWVRPRTSDDLLYVCDRVNDRIQIFKPDGTFVKGVFVLKQTRGDG